MPYWSLRFKARSAYCPRETAPLLIPTHLIVLARNRKAWSLAAHARLSEGARWLARTFLARLAVARSARVIVVSSAMASALPARLVPTTEVVHHGCDLGLVERSRLERDDCVRTLRIVALGTVSAHKRFDAVIDAVAELRAQGQPAHLEIWGSIGDPSSAEWCRRVARERLGDDPLRGPADGFRRQKILADADVLAMGSSVESFGHPLVEGMRTSCLIWAPASTLVDELCGPVAVTYPERSSEGAATALIAALRTAPDLLHAGRERSLAFTWESTVDQTLRAVRDIPSRRSEHDP